jgi:copper chaperone CopZ
MGKIEQDILLVVATVCIASTNSLVAMAAPAPAAAPVKTKSGAQVTKDKNGMLSSTAESKTPAYNPKALHRLDFKITGKSCAVCLLGIQKRITSVPGSIKAAVQLQAPYAAVVLYDSSKTTQKALLDKAQETVPEVKFVSIEDNAVAKVPTVLVPKIGDEILEH